LKRASDSLTCRPYAGRNAEVHQEGRSAVPSLQGAQP
jgi:hypothetical protein